MLVLEPGTGLDGKLKTARKGVRSSPSLFRQSGPFGRRFYRRRERCSGTRPADRRDCRVYGPRFGLTVNPGVVRGGARVSMFVAAEARAESTCASPE